MNPTPGAITIDEIYPLLVACYDALPELVVEWIFEQMPADLDTSCCLFLSEFVRVLSWLLMHKTRFVQVVHNSSLCDTQFVGYIASA